MKRKLRNRAADIKVAVVTDPLYKRGGAEDHIKVFSQHFQRLSFLRHIMIQNLLMIIIRM
jgi:hypothetical protein